MCQTMLALAEAILASDIKAVFRFFSNKLFPKLKDAPLPITVQTICAFPLENEMLRKLAKDKYET